MGVVIAKRELIEAFQLKFGFFSTFGGNPVSMAAAQAVLRVIREEGLQQHSQEVGGRLLAALSELAERHESVGEVRGAGLFIGFELVSDRAQKTPNKALALDVIEKLRDRHVLTSVAGPFGNVLKLRPPLAFQAQDIDWLVDALDHALTEVEHSHA